MNTIPLQSGGVNVLASRGDWSSPGLVEEVFTRRGVNLLATEDSGEFFEILQHRRIHAVMIDCDFEITGGFSIIRIVKRDNPVVPCILVSGRRDEDLLRKALELDADTVLRKPVKAGVLSGQLDRIFGRLNNSDVING